MLKINPALFYEREEVYENLVVVRISSIEKNNIIMTNSNMIYSVLSFFDYSLIPINFLSCRSK